MARTRAQEKTRTSDENSSQDRPASIGKGTKKRSQPDDVADDEHQAPPPKGAKQKGKSKSNDPKIQKLLSKYGTFPLEDSGLKDPESPTPETMLAHILHAQLVSARISHRIAAKTFHEIIKAGYADLATLENSSWEERTKILTKGRYTHYREKTATELGGLADLVRERYNGDLNDLIKTARLDDSGKVRSVVRDGLKQIKGVGDVALDVFCDTAQGLWPELAPFLDARSLHTAKKIGVPAEVDELYEAVGKDPVAMCRLSAALATVRLKKLEGEFV